MALAWQAIDVDDPDRSEPRFVGDPAALVDAWAELAALARYRPWWHQHAACRGQGVELFFPDRGASTAGAKAICASCTVAEECRAAGALERHGIWAGAAERQRRRERRTAA